MFINRGAEAARKKLACGRRVSQDRPCLNVFLYLLKRYPLIISILIFLISGVVSSERSAMAEAHRRRSLSISRAAQKNDLAVTGLTVQDDYRPR